MALETTRLSAKGDRMVKKIGFVPPWYGEDIPGGAEAELRNLIKHLHMAGLELEILTTCVKDFKSNWSINYHQEGFEEVNNIPVWRFRVRERNTKLFDKVNYKLMHNIPITYEEEKIYFDEMIYSPGLFDYIAKHKDEYHCFVFIPYMFGTTFWGSKICPEKSVLIPCLHDESYAYMEHIKEMFTSVKGVIFHAQPEYELANNIYDLKQVKTAVLGEGIDTDFTYDADRFRTKYNIRRPFILYAGRKDKGKNVHILIEYFKKFKVANKNIDLDLVLLGGGEIEIPLDVQKNIHDLGFVSNQDKYDAHAAATVFCQPSTNESFSIVIMESWVTGRPVLVHSECAVTKHFSISSNGGLYFGNYEEFEECLKFFINNEQVANKMGELGKRFVFKNFSWDVIIKRYTSFLKTITNEDD